MDTQKEIIEKLYEGEEVQLTRVITSNMKECRYILLIKENNKWNAVYHTKPLAFKPKASIMEIMQAINGIFPINDGS